MIVAKFSSSRVPILSLRAKISHSWLDHEVAMVSTELAMDRWRAGQWSEIAVRWGVLHGLALKLSEALPNFGSVTLVDTIAPLKVLGVSEKKLLRQRLALLHAQLIDVEALQAAYLRRLDSFWKAATVFFERTIDPMATNSDIAEGWEEVGKASGEFKRLFQDGTLPDGIVLP